MTSRRMITAKRNAYDWIQHADELYIPVRFLLCKGFDREFVLLGAFVMELYLKAFLIYKTGKYPQIHWLDEIYEMCIEHDEFFKDKSLMRDMVSPELKTWPRHTDLLRYPEPFGDKRKYRWTMWGTDSHRTLDRIAHFVRTTVPRPENSLDTISEFLSGSTWGSRRTTYAEQDWLEIRECFLKDNEDFQNL